MTPQTQSKSHDWVRHTLTEVDVIVDPFTEDCSVVDRPDTAIGEAVGCSCCGEPLTEASLIEPCTP